MQTDIYGLCATLYHLLTNVKPADALDRAAKIIDRKPDPLRPAREINPRLSTELSQLLEAGLQLSSNERPASIDTVQEMLSRAAASSRRIEITLDSNSTQSGQASRPTTTSSKTFRSKSYRRLTLLTTVSLVTVIIIGLAGHRFWLRGEAQAQLAAAQSSERAEGILNNTACQKYSEIEPDYLSAVDAKDLVKKINDCVTAESLLQQADKTTQEKGLNQETVENYRKIETQYPKSVPAYQAGKRIARYDATKKATIQAWSDIQESEYRLKLLRPDFGNPESFEQMQMVINQLRQFKPQITNLVNNYGRASTENVDTYLANHISKTIEVLNELAQLFDAFLNDLVSLVSQARECNERWFDQGNCKRSVLQQVENFKAKYEQPFTSMADKAKNQDAARKTVSAELERKYGVAFIMRH